MLYSSILLASVAALAAANPLDKRASCGNEGVEYAVFDLIDNKIGNNGPGYSAFSKLFPELQKMTPKYTGTIKKLGYSVNSGTDKVYDQPIEDSGWFAVEHRFWLCAPKTGQYTFRTVGKQDDNTWAWIGKEAFKDFNYGNCKVNSGFFGAVKGEHKCNIEAGHEIPIRIISSECDAPATFGFEIVAPDGTVLIGPNKECTANIKRWICGKDDTKFPPYKKPEVTVGPQNTCSNGGVNYAIWALEGGDRLQNADKGYTAIKPLIPKLEGMAPDAVGVTKVLGFDSGPASKAGKIYQSEWTDYNWFAVEHRFYVVADSCGQYTFKTIGLQDDNTWAWVGDTAYKGYTYDNAVINDGFYGTVKGKEHKCKLRKGQRLAVRILSAECATPAIFKFSITNPAGKVLIGPDTEASPYIVQWCCGNEKPKFPPYKPVKPPKPKPPPTPVKPPAPVKPATDDSYDSSY